MNSEFYQANVSIVNNENEKQILYQFKKNEEWEREQKKFSDKFINEWILANNNNNNIDQYITKHLYGVGITDEEYKIWINFEQYHSMPLAVNVFFEMLLKSIEEEEEYRQKIAKTRTTTSTSTSTSILSPANIKLQSSPLITPRNAQSKSISMLIVSWAVVCLSIIPNAFIYMGASYILQPIRENSSKAKLLQLMTGLSPVTYWMVNIVFDLFCTHLMIISFIVIFMAVLDFDHIFMPNIATGSAFIVLIFMYGLAVIPFAYTLSYCFAKTSRGYTVMIQISSYLGTLGGSLLATGDLMINYYNVQSSVFRGFYFTLLYPLRIVPIFSVVFGFQKIYRLSNFARFCEKLDINQQLESICRSIITQRGNNTNDNDSDGDIFRGCCVEVCNDSCYVQTSPWSVTSKFGIGTEIIYLLVTGIIFFISIVAYECKCDKLMIPTNNLTLFYFYST